MAKNSNRRYTQEELEQLHTLYVEENMPEDQCAKILKRPLSGVRKQISKHKWGLLRRELNQSIKEVEAQSKAILKKPEGFEKEFLQSVARRSADATSTAFDHFEKQAAEGDLYKMETAIKIADRASAIARKAMGLDGPGAGNAGSVTFNVYYGEDAPVRKVKKVTPDGDNSDNSDDSIDI
jgi:hypothetical protein